MNQVISIKSKPIYIFTMGLLIICLHGPIFLPMDDFLYSARNISKDIYGERSANFDGQPDLHQNLYAQSDGPILTNPDWVPPVNRNKYPGYQIMEDAKSNSEIWKYSTNRPGGKIKGGGTVKYRDYRSITKQTRPESGGGTGKPRK